MTVVPPGGDPPDLAAEQPWFREVSATRTAVIGGIGPVGPASGTRRVTLRAPVIRNGRVLYVVSVALVPDGIAALLRRRGRAGRLDRDRAGRGRPHRGPHPRYGG